MVDGTKEPALWGLLSPPTPTRPAKGPEGTLSSNTAQASQQEEAGMGDGERQEIATRCLILQKGVKKHKC